MASIVTPGVICQLPGHNRNARQVADVENNFITSCKHVQNNVLSIYYCAQHAVRVNKLIIKRPKLGCSPKLGQLTVLRLRPTRLIVLDLVLDLGLCLGLGLDPSLGLVLD